MKKLWILLWLLCSCTIIDEKQCQPLMTVITTQVNVEQVDTTGLVYEFEDSLIYRKPESLYGSVFINNNYFRTYKLPSEIFHVRYTDIVDVIITDRPQLDTIYEKPTLESYYGKIEGITGYNQTWDEHGISELYVDVNPISHLYIAQIIIEQDLNEHIVAIDSARVSGISFKRDVYRNIILNEPEELELKVHEVQIKDNAQIFGMKFISFGLPSSMQSENSWDISATLRAELTFKVKLDETVKHVNANITKKIIDCGVITIKLKQSDIIKGNTGIDTSVGEWNRQEININI